MRLNTYAFPHKALRNLLSQVSFAAGNADPTFPETLKKLKGLYEELKDFLEEHAQVEDEIILPALEAREPGSIQENLEEHEYLEEKFSVISKQLRELNSESPAKNWNDFYWDFSEFHAEYLKHMLLEEKEVLEKIWANFSDEELFFQHQQILSTFTPDQILKTFKYIIPSLSTSEQIIAMKGLKSMAPEAFFRQVMEEIRLQMPGKEFGELSRILNQTIDY